MAIGEAFDNSVAYYDGWVRKAVPGYDDLFAIARELLPFPAAAPIEVLDLGAGTGLFSWQVLAKYPQARFVLCDVADRMLDVARERFRDYPDQFRYLLSDYRELRDPGRFDLVISSLSIHHLADEEKKALCGRVYALLRDGGMFVNIDQIKGPTPGLQELYWNTWLAKIRQAGATEEEVRAGIERRLAYDREATLADQLRWLEEAGFADVDCIYKNYLIGLIIGVKKGRAG
ncbi:SAM-dependent methyltransferase [Geotalea uraniireducens]|uniref:SAM-dependent methyltransferase n=1 Tax=Geotalea uraniireducens TaxID=351604 RepID=A0ABN6VWR9_9BACT|nr:class I SAM-dependent methyltransferase [Geotalea uraniireducens]BDV44859.1 SAM-dependent methyltransferase [Geotalea uraniireducens]